MPKRVAPLSDLQVKNAKPKEKDYKLIDGFGLHLLVTSKGGKLWRYQYRYDGKQKLLSFGPYPLISLSEARERRDSARKHLANGNDPSTVKKAQKLADKYSKSNTFKAVALEWNESRKESWTEKHGKIVLNRLESKVFPYIGDRPIGEIKPPEILEILKNIEATGALHTAKRLRTICGQVFRYAVATGRAERDPTPDLKGALKPPTTRHMAAITEPDDAGGLMRAIEDYQGSFPVKCALKLAAMFFVRPNELRRMEWREINFEKAEWHIPVERMKMPLKAKRERKGQTHIVPLSKQAIAILLELRAVTGYSRYAFPSYRTAIRPMSDNAILSALRRMGYAKDEMSGHGFRAMARTILDEVLHVRPDYIEHQLAHAVRDPNGRAYNRTAHLPERRKMMQDWSDYLDKLREGAKVIPFKEAK